MHTMLRTKAANLLKKSVLTSGVTISMFGFPSQTCDENKSTRKLLMMMPFVPLNFILFKKSLRTGEAQCEISQMQFFVKTWLKKRVLFSM